VEFDLHGRRRIEWSPTDLKAFADDLDEWIKPISERELSQPLAVPRPTGNETEQLTKDLSMVLGPASLGGPVATAPAQGDVPRADQPTPPPEPPPATLPAANASEQLAKDISTALGPDALGGPVTPKLPQSDVPQGDRPAPPPEPPQAPPVTP
jgi:hypothetical protein